MQTESRRNHKLRNVDRTKKMMQKNHMRLKYESKTKSDRIDQEQNQERKGGEEIFSRKRRKITLKGNESKKEMDKN